MKKWENSNELAKEKTSIEDIIEHLLTNRGITSKKERETFLHPKLEDVTPKSVGISLPELKKALKRIAKAIETKEKIIVFGDYDVDGITGSAILWETLYALGANVMPYIPHRVEEGYGLSIPGITNVLEKFPDTKLIITVDNGIVAHGAVDFANERGLEVIITDHHTTSEKTPNAYAIVHTTNLCGAGVAYLLSKELKIQHKKKEMDDTHLELATLGTVADLVPLTGANRAIVKHGLEFVRTTDRLGLRELYNQAGLQKDVFSPYDIGFVIAPRLNASGRIASAMDSLRLLCTTNKERAEELAGLLESTNKERQLLMREAADHAVAGINSLTEVKHILIVHHESYQEGVIGLVAGRLVETFYRPAIVIAKRDTHSKASVRSISGFNIIEFLRSHTDLFVNVGGHPMAAGFTVKTDDLQLLQETLEASAAEILTEELLLRKLKIDCELPFTSLTKSLYNAIQKLAPFGMGNPEPVFATKGVTVQDIRAIGKENAHLKLKVSQGGNTFDAIAFSMGDLASTIKRGDQIDVAYTLDENTWRDRTTLQLKVKDIRLLKTVVE